MNDKKKETKSVQVNLRFTPSEVKAIQKRAEEEGRTPSNLIHTVMMAYLNEKL